MQIHNSLTSPYLSKYRSDTPAAKHTDQVMEFLQRIDEHSSAAKPSSGNPFANMLVQGISQVSDMQNNADGQMEQLLTGADINQAEVFTSVQKADMAFRMLVQIRNKLLQAYEEINSIRV